MEWAVHSRNDNSLDRDRLEQHVMALALFPSGWLCLGAIFCCRHISRGSDWESAETGINTPYQMAALCAVA